MTEPLENVITTLAKYGAWLKSKREQQAAPETPPNEDPEAALLARAYALILSWLDPEEETP